MKKHLIAKSIVAIFLLCAITLPLLTMNHQPGKISETENRYLTDFPQIFMEDGSLTANLASNLHTWFNDNLGFRAQFLTLSSLTQYHLLRQSPSEKVEIGKDGWFFYTQDSNLEIASETYPNFEEQQLEAICAQQMRIQRKLKNQGIEYVLILPPSKVSVYPEKISSGDYAVCRTPVDILADYLEVHSNIKVVRIKDALLEAKAQSPNQLYFKTDTHWTECGAYIGYRKIVESLNGWGLIENAPADVTFTKKNYRGEFSAMMGDKSLLPTETATTSTILNANAVRITEGAVQQAFQELLRKENVQPGSKMFQNTAVSTPRILMYGDSMFGSWNMGELLAENCSAFTYVWDHNIHQEMIDETKPDIVFFEIGERYLNILTQKSTAFVQDILTGPDAKTVSQSIPLTLTAGETATFSVTVENTGTQAWTETDMVRLGIFLNDSDCGTRAYLPANVSVLPGESYTFTFANFVPPTVGAKMEFYMLQEGITYFGNREPANTEIVQ